MIIYRLRKKFDKITALDGISLELPDKGLVFIVGKSGCGKSTLLNVLSGMDGYDGGDVSFEGRSLKDLSPAELDCYRNHYCSFVFEKNNLIPELNVYENIALAGELRGMKDVKNKVASALEKVGLKGYEKRKVTSLSGGQRQRIAIARSIVKDPKLIFADEPCGALDRATGEAVFELLKELSSDKLVLVVSQDAAAAQKYGDRIIELSDGKVISDTDSTYKSETDKQSSFTKKKSRLPILTAIKLGCSNFKFHPFRLVATVILAILAFTCLGSSFVFLTCDPAKEFTDLIYDSGVEYVNLVKYEYGFDYYYDNQEIIGGYRIREDTFFDDSDLKILQGFFDRDLMMVETLAEPSNLYLNKLGYSLLADRYDLMADEKAINTLENKHICNYTSGLVSISEEELDRLGYDLIGRLPISENEVAIPICFYNYVKQMSEKNNLNIVVNSPTDLLGKEISVHYARINKGWLDTYSYLTITGIVMTDCDKECSDANHPYISNYESVDKFNRKKFFQEDNSFQFHEKLFVTREFILSRHKSDLRSGYNYVYGSDSIYHILCPLPKDKDDFTEFVRASYNDKYSSPYLTTYKIDNEYGNYYMSLHNDIIKSETDYGLLGLIFLIFTVLLLFDFIIATMRSQTKQIATMISLGCDIKKINVIYFITAFCLCLTAALLSMITTSIAVGFLRATVTFYRHIPEFKLLFFNIQTAVLLIVSAVATSICGTCLSLVKSRKLSSATMINNGQIK